MRHALFILLIACKSSPAPTTPTVGNAADPAAPAEPAKPGTKVGCKVAQPTGKGDTSSTTGAIAVGVCDSTTGESLAGATIVVTSPALQGEQVGITDETGRLVIGSLPPGEYQITMYYNDRTLTSTAMVAVEKIAWRTIPFDSSDKGGVIINLHGG